MAPRWEKELHRAIVRNHTYEFGRIAQTYPKAAPIAATLDGITLMQGGDPDRALDVLRWVWSIGGVIEETVFAQRYLASSQVTLNVATGVSATMPVVRDMVGLALAELEQQAGNLNAAIQVVESLDPSIVAAVSLVELYLQVGRYDDVVDTTNGLSNTDDATALLVTFRGCALRELGHNTAAREAFKEALKSKARDQAIRHLALVQRAQSYLSDGKATMARKDLERVLAENAQYPGLAELLDTAQGHLS